MRSKASYFSISIPLIKENLRRFWAVPVIAFLIYFLSGVFPILMSYKNLNFMASYIEMSLHNMQPFFMGAHLLVPVISAVLLFRYMQNVSSVAVMHSMPFTRSKLYNSNFITGTILVSLPIIVNGVIMLLLSKPTYRQLGFGEEVSFSTVNVFARGEIFNWMGTSLLIVIVLFSVAVFAAIVTGNNLMHLLTSYFFIFLIPLLYSVFNFYFNEFLYGFDLSGNWIDIALSISPYTAIISGSGYFSKIEVSFYIVTIFSMLIISAFLYNKRKLERASDSLTFNFMKPVICYLIAFLGMTMLGLYFQVLGEGRIYMYAGFAAGTIIFFTIGQMIVTKTARIFNKEGLKNFVAYALIAIIFLAGLNIDITGFERRVPKPHKVQGVYFEGPYNSGKWNTRLDAGKLTTAENVAALTSFHRSVLDNRKRFEENQENLYTSYLKIRYDIKGFFDMSRRYHVDYLFWAENEDLRTIFESAEYKSNHSFYNSKVEKYTKAYFYSDVYSAKDSEIRDERLVGELIANMEKDFREMNYKDFVSLRPSYVNIELEYRYNEKEATEWRNGNGYMSFSLPSNAKNTISWLKAQGYNFDLASEMVEWIEIYESKHDYTNSQRATDFKPTKDYDYINKYGERNVLKRVTDEESIAEILSHYDSAAINYDTAYEINIAYKPIAKNEDFDRDNIDGLNHISGYLNGNLDFLN